MRRAGEPGASYAQLSTLAKRGDAIRLAPGIYVVGAALPLDQVVSHHASAVIAGVWPGAVLCARTAFAGGAATDGAIYLCPGGPDQRSAPLKLPGLTVVPVAGPARLPGDMAMPDGLFLSGTARGLVENTAVRGRPAPWRAGTAAVEDRIDELARTGGPGRIQKTLDQLDVIENSFDPAPVALVRSRLAAVLGSFTSTSSAPASGRLAARLAGVPFDAHRIELMSQLVRTLAASPPVVRSLTGPAGRWQWQPFFEAYFSNFIEGTEFGVDEARLIAVDGVVPEARPADAHDVSATYRLAVDPAQRATVPRSGEELVELLRQRHATLMAARPDKEPGELKRVANYAGGYAFVPPELVVGTLTRGFDEMGQLIDPFSRAVAMMVLVTECHPFLDGNGRVARLMMNAELSVAGQVRICIPTVFRPDYLSALTGFSGGAGTGQSLIAVLAFAQRWTAEIDWTTFDVADAQVAASNAYLDPAVAGSTGRRLTLPSAVPPG